MTSQRPCVLGILYQKLQFHVKNGRQLFFAPKFATPNLARTPPPGPSVATSNPNPSATIRKRPRNILVRVHRKEVAPPPPPTIKNWG